MPATDRVKNSATLHVAALASFAVAQPLYEVLAESPEFFVAHRATSVDVAVLVLLLLAGPAIGAALVLWLAGFAGSHARTIALSLLVAGVVGAVTLQALKRVGDLPSTIGIPAALAFGGLAALLYTRRPVLRTFATLLALGLVIFPVRFLLRPSIAGIVRPPRINSAPPVDVPSRRPVVFVIFDQLPLSSLIDANGQIERMAYPSFAALADGATWYRNATTVSPVTGWAVPAMLTGRRPRRNTLPVAADHPDNLFTLLGSSYALHVHEPITDLCPESLCPRPREALVRRLVSMMADVAVVYLHVLLPSDLAARLPPVTQEWRNFVANQNWQRRFQQRELEDRDDLWQTFLDSIGGDETRSLYYIHILLPHDPYVYLPSGQRYSDDRSLPGLIDNRRWTREAWPVTQAYGRHLLQVGYVDRLLGQLLSRLRDYGLYDQSLIVIASDHGASIRPGWPLRDVEEATFPSIMAVPLFIKRPFQEMGEVSDRNVETIDILPTLADLLGVKLPWAVDGVSAVDPAAPDKPSKRISYDRVTRERTFGPSLLGQTLALARRKRTLFGSDGNTYRLPRGAPAPELFGRSLSDLTVIDSTADLRVELNGSERFAEVDPSGQFVPAQISGRLLGAPAGETLALAVAVNGVIRVTTRTRRSTRQRTAAWSAFIPPEGFQQGANKIEVLVVRTELGGLTLERVSERASSAN